MSTPTAGTSIFHVDASLRLDAIGRLLSQNPGSDPDQARKFLEYAINEKISLEWMWAVAEAGGQDDAAGRPRILATVLVVPNAGRTAMVFTSSPGRRVPPSLIASLIDHACEQIDPERVALAQALVVPGESVERQCFFDAGFTQLATLRYLERAAPRRGEIAEPTWPADVRISRYHDDLRSDIMTAMERSYVETMDCPGLVGLRRTEDVLEGHKSIGRFDPELWLLLYVDDEPCGCLLLNHCPASRSAELAYLGLSPETRGRGLGQRLLCEGLMRVPYSTDCSTIALAVDEKNAPASALYARFGFRVKSRRSALIRPIEPSVT